jgi:hypothetical protein
MKHFRLKGFTKGFFDGLLLTTRYVFILWRHGNIQLFIYIFQSINVVDCPELRELLLFIGTEIEDYDIPHRTKLSELITSRFKVEYNRMIEDINVRFRPFYL